jgi:hypothetical protein
VVSLDTMLRLFIPLSIPLAVELLVCFACLRRLSLHETSDYVRHVGSRYMSAKGAAHTRSGQVLSLYQHSYQLQPGCGCAAKAVPVRPRPWEDEAGLYARCRCREQVPMGTRR